MVEETIVYGNRYRSDIVEMNNTLTQVELLFRNGEYFEASIALKKIYRKSKKNSFCVIDLSYLS